MGILQKAILGVDDSIINITKDNEFWAVLGVIVAALVVATVGVLAIIMTGRCRCCGVRNSIELC